MFRIETTIDRPPGEVFAYLADVEKAPAWYSAVQSVTPLQSGAVAVGDRFTFVRELGGSKVSNEVEITELVDGRVITLESKKGPTPFTYRYSVSGTESKANVKLEGEISGEGLPGLLALAGPLASKAFERGMKTNLAALKSVLEQ